MPKTEVVKKANALIEAAYHPTSLYQMRLLLVAISQIKDGEKLTYKTQFEISAQGVADLVGIAGKSGGHYYQLKKAAKDLVDWSISVTKHADGRPRARRWSQINIVNECVYCEDEAKVILTFTPAIIPYISGLQGLYKAYKLTHVIRMKSTYGMRLYELCLQWKFPNDWKEITVDDFRHIMGLGDKYRIIADMRKCVILPRSGTSILAATSRSPSDNVRPAGPSLTYNSRSRRSQRRPGHPPGRSNAAAGWSTHQKLRESRFPTWRPRTGRPSGFTWRPTFSQTRTGPRRRNA